MKVKVGLKIVFASLTVVLLVPLIFMDACKGGKMGVDNDYGAGEHSTESAADVLYYTCGMHPKVKVSPREYESGRVNCPICNMKLTPVFKQEEKGKKKGKGPLHESHSSIGSVSVDADQAALAGVVLEKVQKRRLYKVIRTVGKVAYDPQLTVAEQEYVSSLKMLEKAMHGEIREIQDRLKKLVDSAERKLRLLGLSDKQIEELRNTGKIHTNLVLPEAKMWIYGDVYEYELMWVKKGASVDIIVPGLPGEKFSGVITSIDPVVDPRTRSVRFRAEVVNRYFKLKPEMYVDVFIRAEYVSPGGDRKVLAVSKDAVLDTGLRKIVWVNKGSTRYEGRVVEVGPEAVANVEGKELLYYPVLSGLSEGELIVARANFLIDSQSRIYGEAATAYGGALNVDKFEPSGQHRH